MWAEIADAKTVLDFGGGCGLHYKQARLLDVKWAVVETSAMVARASEIQTGRLRFFTDIVSAANWLGDIDVMHSNGAIQYAEDPISTLAKLCSLGAKKMLWYRTNLANGRLEKDTQVSRLVDNGPGKIGGIGKKFVSVTVTGFRRRHSLTITANTDLTSAVRIGFGSSENPNNVVAHDRRLHVIVGVAAAGARVCDRNAVLALAVVSVIP